MKNKVRHLKKLIEWLNDISIKRKIMIIYLFCVLVPIVAINSIFYMSISKNVKKEEKTNTEQSMNRVLIDITTQVEQCVRVGQILNSNSELNKILENENQDVSTYLTEYKKYIQTDVQRFEPVYNQIANINIYTSNNTIPSGGNVLFLDYKVKEADWYNTYLNSNERNIIFPNIVEGTKGLLGDKRYISVISSLNNLQVNDRKNKFVKIDLSINSFKEVLRGEKFKGTLYLIDGENRVIFSNNPLYSNNWNEYLELNSDYFTENDYVISKSFGESSYLNQWTLIGVFEEKSLSENIGGSSSIVVFTAFISLIITTIIIIMVSFSIKSRLELVSNHINELPEKNFQLMEVNPGKDEIGVLIKEVNRSTLRIKNLIDEVYEAGIQKNSAELKALQSQINPHFLYNTLNTVRLRCVLKKENETADIIKYMAKIFRRIVNWNHDIIEIREELEFVEDFLKIQKYRYGEKLSYIINTGDNIENYKIPKMTIQTLVENASIHGIELSEKQGKITIDVNIIEDRLCVQVKDNGVGIEKNKLIKIKAKLYREDKNDEELENSVGLINVYKRLNLEFSNSVYFDIESIEDQGTKVCFAIPLIQMN
ncbi:sensor histidine kinase [Clostridium grantii]|uniref:Two-component system, sensor histidine kinase YesM n=1 Tax=Clostridium grantii DSM 8605 TaxID=1121316 RepID=A0A1M5VVF4_9CLOT|nr:histidine kinase [Clostridium grantii]SHH79242.1 two-component system, sensor histidine kinase YesM [Clostridium grantii DSM 8605]